MKSEHDIFYVNNFDILRLLTAMLVLVNHSFVHLQIPVPGWYSVIQLFQPVPMFFIMSGFLISASLERNSNIHQYFTNRFSRIFPALWVCILITIVAYSAMAGANFYHAEAIPWVLAQFVGFIYTPSFLDQFGFGSYNGSLWTIVVELQFYVLLPLIYMVHKRFHMNNWYFVILFLLAVSIAFVLRPSFLSSFSSAVLEKIVRYSLSSHAYLFLAGLLMHRFKFHHSVLVRGKAIYWTAAFLILNYFLPASLLSHVINSLMLACLTLSFAYTLPGFASGWIGKKDISYGLFLYHGIPLSLLVEWELSGSIFYMGVVGGVTILLAMFSFHFVESPAMAWAKRRNNAVTLRESLIRANIATIYTHKA